MKVKKSELSKTEIAVVDRIRDLMVEKNISINELAARCGIPRTTLRDILNHVSHNPKILNLKCICDGLNISLREFFDTDTFENLEQEIR